MEQGNENNIKIIIPLSGDQSQSDAVALCQQQPKIVIIFQFIVLQVLFCADLKKFQQNNEKSSDDIPKKRKKIKKV